MTVCARVNPNKLSKQNSEGDDTSEGNTEGGSGDDDSNNDEGKDDKSEDGNIGDSDDSSDLEAGILTDGGLLQSKDCLRIKYQSKVYLICKGPKSKADAVNFCSAQKMSLALIDSEKENKWLIDTALKTHGCTTYQQTSYWIANMATNSPMTWPSGQSVWSPGEPRKDGNDINIARYCATPYGWNDLDAKIYTLGWICKSK